MNTRETLWVDNLGRFFFELGQWKSLLVAKYPATVQTKPDGAYNGAIKFVEAISEDELRRHLNETYPKNDTFKEEVVKIFKAVGLIAVLVLSGTVPDRPKVQTVVINGIQYKIVKAL